MRSTRCKHSEHGRARLPSAAHFVAALLVCAIGAADTLGNAEVSVRLMEGEKTVSVHSSGPIVVSSEGAQSILPTGTYAFSFRKVRPARQAFHLFAKTFQPSQQKEEKAYLKQWRAKGFRPEVVVMGRVLKTRSGKVLDSRVHWISIFQAETEAGALAKKAQLEAQKQWTWMRAVRAEPGRGVIRVKSAFGKTYGPYRAPLRIESAKPISIDNVDVGFWEDRRSRQQYRGILELHIDPQGRFELIERMAVETYLRGVLPAEMPASWPMDALKAQAVAARSEVIANLSLKHHLEGFDFCNVEHCRAYLGSAAGVRSTDEALSTTRGEILLDGTRIIPAVFSSTCGGWTENNDTVWFGPADASLRGVPDSDSKRRPGDALKQWISEPAQAFCDGDENYFRWRRSFSEQELSKLVNLRHAVGRIQRIELGDRGVSGRLKWVKIVGSKKTETIRKELPIRQAFGGLPSALFMVEVQRGKRSPKRFAFVGGGRGHGVGLCQNGAKGMAGQGIVYTKILGHYFLGSRVERYQ